MKRVIVTGGTGFVGANLARRLLDEGHEVHLIARKNHDPWRIRDIAADLRMHHTELDLEALLPVVGGIRPDWVFHLAAHGAYPQQRDLSVMVETNIMGTINLVEACLRTGFEIFVNTGSSSEYGFKDHATTEDEPAEPNSHYAVTKVSATLFCRFTARSRGVRLPTLRLYSVYGPYEEPTRLMPTLVVRGLRGELPPLAAPDLARDYVHVDDVSEAYILAAMREDSEAGAIYNVGTGVQTTLREVVATARRVLGITKEPSWGSLPSREWDTTVWVADNDKLRERLGWEHRISVEEGFRRLTDWFQGHDELRRSYEDRLSRG